MLMFSYFFFANQYADSDSLYGYGAMSQVILLITYCNLTYSNMQIFN